MAQIVLPSDNWFRNEYKPGAGNIYTGSVGTDPERGGIVVTTFQYKAKYTQNEEDKTILAVSWYFCPPWGVERQEGDCGEAVFEASQEGIDAAVAYLTAMWDAGVAGGKYILA